MHASNKGTADRPQLRAFAEQAQCLAIAVTLSDRHLTASECSRAMGVTPATITRPLERMCDAGVIECDDPDRARGAHYWLAAECLEELEKEVAEGQPPGWLLSGQRLLSVRADRLLELARALEPGELVRSLAWVVEIDGGRGYLLAIDQKRGHVAAGRLRAALESAAVECTPIAVSTILSAAEFRRHLDAAREAVGR